MSSKVQLVTESWETVDDICRRTGSARDIVTSALKRLWKDNSLSCFFQKAESDDQQLRYRLRGQNDLAIVEA